MRTAGCSPFGNQPKTESTCVIILYISPDPTNHKTTKKFLGDSSDLICVNDDKGNITVCMRKFEYISDMEQLLNNPEDFDRLNENPLKKLKSSSFRILDN